MQDSNENVRHDKARLNTSETPGYIHAAPDGVILSVHVQPRARRTALAGLHGEAAVRVKVTQPPVDGKANRALVRFIADLLHVSTAQVSILSGGTSRKKLLKITGTTMEQTIEYLNL